jgi:hypothetical protein
MRILKSTIAGVLITGLAFALLSCATLGFGPKATLEIVPAKTFLSPALIGKPVSFNGTGFAPKEMVSVEMVLPKGMKMKGINEGEDVGLAVGTADDKGNFSAKMAPTATLNWFFQVGWTPLLRPNFKEAKPIPPGEYKIKATGLESDIMAKAVLTIVPPPKKKK